MRNKKKVLLFCTVFLSFITLNGYSDRLENGHSWEPECECDDEWTYAESPYHDDKDPIGPFTLVRGKDFEIDDIA